MRNTIIRWLTAICLSSLLSYIWPSLPPLSTLFLVTGTLTLIAGMLYLHHSTRLRFSHWKSRVVLVHGFCVGAMWMASVGHWYYAWQLPRNKIHQDVIVTGTVVQATCKNDWHTYILNTDLYVTDWLGSRKIRVHEQSLHDCMQPNDIITATVRLKPAYGVANPIGFNYQQYLASQGIVATGSLRQRHQRIRHGRSLRQALQAIISAHPYGSERWLSILLLGNKSALSDEDWALLRRTGTGHLFSISGLHMGIVAGALLPIIGGLAAVCTRSRQRTPSRRVLPTTLLLVAGGTLLYAAITGAALPVMRAWLLLAAGSLINLSNRHWNGGHKGVAMLTGCLLLFPLTVLSPGFYLSAGAVAIIWALCWRWQWHHLRWYQCLWRLQLALSIALLPLTSGWFSMISLSAIPINLLMVPLMTLLLPFILLLLGCAWLFPVLAATAMWAANHLVGAMIMTVQRLDQHLPSPLTIYPDTSVLIALLLALITMCLPGFRFQRHCAALLCLPLILAGLPPTLKRWDLHVLDAGQGTAVLITRGRRAIVVDTGASHQHGAPTAENVLVPLITRYNLIIDYVILSHDDNDHAGGAPVLQRYLAQQGQSPRWLSPHNGCSAGREVTWQGLQLAMLWPPDRTLLTGNNASCVILIKGLGHRLLLPGDVERSAEYALLAENSDVHADVLVAPHHGSSTSSTGIFIDKVSPQVVIFTQGFENRWGFPASSVVTRYQEAGAKLLTTSESGYIRLSMREGQPLDSKTLRHDLQPRWYRRPITFHTMD